MAAASSSPTGFSSGERAVGDQPALLLTYTAAAAELAVSYRTIRRLVADGELPTVSPVAGAPRIVRADLEAFVEARRDVAGGVPVGAGVRRRPRRVSDFRARLERVA